MKSSQSNVIERLQQAQNAHDLKAFLACFAPNIRSTHPLHPERNSQGIEHVRKNWSNMFHDIPDFQSELLSLAVDGDTIWAEWHWFGTRRDGIPFSIRGVSIVGVQGDQIEWARFYMEPV